MNFSPEKLLLVGVIALVVLGPHRLPQAARTLGKFVADIRRVSASFQTEVRDAIDEPRNAISGAVGEFGLPDLRKSLRDTVTGIVTGPPASPAQAQANPTQAATNGAQTQAAPIPAAHASLPSLPPAPDDPSLN